MPVRRTPPLHFCLLVVLAPGVGVAQVSPPRPSAGDSAYLVQLKTNLTLALASLVYWNDTRSESAVADCQVRYGDFCVANHNGSTFSVAFGPSIRTPRAIRPGAWPENFVPLSSILPLLREGAATAPDNGWFVGQIALLHVSQGNPQLALDAVRDCRGDRAWCFALRGFALHSEWRFAEAESAFAQALDTMPAEKRCRWRDISRLLDEESRRAYRALDCAARAAFEDRVWWLADPLYEHSGNDRKTEHFARRVLDSLYAGALSPFGHVWNANLGDMLLRFGMPSHWIIAPDWAHHETPSYHFIPSMAALTPHAVVEPEHWKLSVPMNEAPERYHPGYGFVAELTHAQVVAFPRGDSMLIAAAAALGEEPIGPAGPFIAALAVGVDHRSPMRLSALQRATDRAAFAMTASRETVLVSLEVMSSEWELAGRLRFSLEPPPISSAPALSQLLLFAPAGAASPGTVEAAAARMLGTDVILRGEPLGVFWESYGLPANTPGTTAVTVTPLRTRAGLLTRVGRALRLVDKPGNVLVRWTAPSIASGEGAGHAIAVNLSGLELGTYLLTVTVEVGDGVRATASRTIDVVSRRPPVEPMEDALQQAVPQVGSSPPHAIIRRRENAIPPPR